MKLIKIVMIALMSMSLAQATAFEKDAKARNVKVHLSADKPLVAGRNEMVFTVSKGGKVLKGAQVNIKAFMPAMPGMPAMSDKVKATSLGNGKFSATINFAMSGTWQVHIFIAPKTGKKMRVKTSVNI